jgi:Na+/melibiose symporter-like transporter
VRSEGLLFAANGLLPKFTSGIGAFIAGLMLSAVHFPLSAAPGTVDPQILRHLACLSLPLGAGLSLLATGVLIFYRIDRSSHERSLEVLQAGAAPAGPTQEPPFEASPLPAPCI